MHIPLDREIRTQVAAVLGGNVALRDFYQWFVPATWDVERTENPEAVRLTRDLAHLFSELSAGLVTRDEVRQRLEQVLAAPSRPDHQRIA